MIILRKIKDPGEKWQEISEIECLKETEGSGSWPEGTVMNMLKDGRVVPTMFAEFKKQEGDIK